ncbi:hypothetical protein GCM10009677_61490 [Sphaerisporangium rubeum]
MLGGAAAGLGLIALGLPAWAGGMIVAFAVLAGAALRVILPDRTESLLTVRRRSTDLVTYGLLGVVTALVAASLTVPRIFG